MRKVFSTLAAATMLIAGGASVAHADSGWMVRGRVLNVIPDEGGDLNVRGVDTIPGDVDIDDSFVPELDISYFLNDNIAFELILGVTPHDVTATDVVVPGGATLDGEDLELGDVGLGDVWLLPPTLTAQYHFTNFGSFKPYVGAGVNYTIFFDESAGATADSIDYDASFGGALQAGFDYDLDGEAGGWALNVDVKKVWITTDVTVDLSTALSPVTPLDEVFVDTEVDINPWIVGVGAGYRF